MRLPFFRFSLSALLVLSGGGIQAVLAVPAMVEVFVSPKGADQNSGSSEAPFASLARARDAVRERDRNKGAVIQLLGGVYSLDSPFSLRTNDGGSDEAPIIYQATPGVSVRITGGIEFPLSHCLPVTDPEILGRLPETASGRVRQIDLRALGISHFDPPPLFGHGMGSLEKGTNYRKGATASELFCNGDPMTLARWPNEGYAKVGNVIEKGDIIRAWMDDAKGGKASEFAYVPPEERNNRPKGFTFTLEKERLTRWQTARDIMLFGYWFYNWSDQSVQVASMDSDSGVISSVQPSAYGIRTGQRFYAYNLLEELDTPGEWFLDRNTGLLYLYPPIDDPNARIEFSTLIEPLVSLEDASHVRFEGIDFSTTRGSAFRIQGGGCVEVRNCRIRNTGSVGIEIEGGRSHTVRNCEIYNTGAGGVSVTGGDISTLSPGGHAVENNLIRNFARLEKNYRPAIGLKGVGLRIAHNEIHDSAHAAIIFSGNNHLIEYNHIYDVCRESDDAAAIYSGRSWTSRGTIIRYNLLRDISGFKQGTHRVSGVYLDDGLSGTTVSANIFLNVAQGIFFNGGRDNIAESNLFIDNANMMRGTDLSNAFKTWAAGSWKTLNHGLAKQYLLSEVWNRAYPALATLTADEPQFPKNNIVKNNRRYRTPLVLGSDGPNYAKAGTADSNQKGIEDNFVRFGRVENNVEVMQSPGFYDRSIGRFQFASGWIEQSAASGLEQISVGDIGRK